MSRPSMSVTTGDRDSESIEVGEVDPDGVAGEGKTASRVSGDKSVGQPVKPEESGYDVVSSAASPHPVNTRTRWDLFLLFNVAIPILLVLIGIAIVRAFGVAEARPLPPPDTSPAAVLESLPETRVERIRSLQETGRQLELVIDGNVVPYREANLSSEVAGRVIYKSPASEAGSSVTAGEVLMRIDP